MSDKRQPEQIGMNDLMRAIHESPSPASPAPPPASKEADFGGGDRNPPERDEQPTMNDLMRAIHAPKHW